jgi:ATP-dependent DNA helicase RecG
VLQGVGPKTSADLMKIGMKTLGDMLYYFPRRYEDYSLLKPIQSLMYNDVVTVLGTIQSVHNRPIRGGKQSLIEVIISDGTGALRISFFNQPWLMNRFKQGEAISVSGKIDQYLGRIVMNSPDWESVDMESLHTNRIVPIYSLTEGITQKWLRKIMNQVVTYWAPAVVDALPDSIKRDARLVSLGEALTQAHFPDSQERLKHARERLAFDEIFYLQMGVLRQKQDWQSVEGRRFTVSDEWLGARLGALPFTLTSAQQESLNDIRRDLDSGRPMNRLIQGDVGSGKTVVAALGAAWSFRTGRRLPSWRPRPFWRNSITATSSICWLAKTDSCKRKRSACWWGTRPRVRKKRSVRGWQMVRSRSHRHARCHRA